MNVSLKFEQRQIIFMVLCLFMVGFVKVFVCVTGLMVAAGRWPPFPPLDMEPTRPAPPSL